jgi:hypothetical protein
MGFPPGEKAVVREYDDDNWIVHRPIRYRTADGRRFTVHPGMHTDFASTPRMFLWFLPRTGRYTKAAILHDYLWREQVPAGQLSLVQADALFRNAMAEMGVPLLRRWIMWTAVRWAALTKPGGRTGWLKQSWLAMVITLLAAPIVLPPALLIVVSLFLFWLAELVVWAPPRLVAKMRKQTGRGAMATSDRPRFPVEAVRSP